MQHVCVVGQEIGSMRLSIDEANTEILVRWVVLKEAHVWLHDFGLVAADITDCRKVGARSTKI